MIHHLAFPQSASREARGKARIWRHHVGRGAKPRQEADGEPGVVQLPPAVAVARRARIGMMVVVPAFAMGDQADDDVVAPVLVGLETAVTPQMRSPD